MTAPSPFPTPDPETTASACLTFSHDFGLLSDVTRLAVVTVAQRWLSAWRTGFACGAQIPGLRGLGDDDGEPRARTIDAACVSFDPAFRTHPFHEASAIRRTGIAWLRAWRRAFDDEDLPTAADVRGIMAGEVIGRGPDKPESPLDRAEAAVDRAAQAAVELLALFDSEPARPSTLSDVAVEAVAVLEKVVLAHLRAVLQSNPDQPFVDFKSIAAALGIDQDTTRAILWRLKKRGAVDWQPLFPDGDYGILLQGGGYAIAQGASDGT